MNKEVFRKNLIFAIVIMAVVSAGVYYTKAGIFKTNTQVVNDLTSGLVGYWTFDGQDTDWGANTTSDMSTNSNTGTMTNMSTSTDAVSGIIGQALDFDGDDDMVVVADSASLGDFTSFTLAAWINPKAALSSNGDRIISKTLDASYGDDYAMYYDTNEKISGRIYTTEIIFYTGSTTININTGWHHAVVVWDGNFLKGYVDGVEDGTPVSASGIIRNSNDNLAIGKHFNSPTEREFSGSIDEVRIYNRSLSANEITELYNQGASRVATTNVNQKTDVVGSGLVGYWPFDGQDTDWGANTTSDMSTNSNTGTMTNMSTTTSPVKGTIGQAMDFDGVDDYINAGDIDAIDGLSAVTFTSWAKWKGGTLSSYALTAVKAYGAALGGGGLSTSKAHFYVRTNEPAWKNSGASSTSIDDGKWHFLVGVFNGSDVFIYVDGVLENSNNIGATRTLDSSAYNMQIGSCVGGPDCSADGENWNGSIDEVRVYNRALSANEITELYNQGSSRVMKVSTNQKTDVVGSGLVGYWTFDGPDTDWGANTTSDMSTNSNTGTMTNMSTSSSPAKGIIGQALEFDGNDDYVDVGNNSSLNLGDFGAVGFWFRYLSIPQHAGVVSKSDWAGDLDGYTVGITADNKVRGQLANGINSNEVRSTNTYNDNNWHHALFTWNNTNLMMYIDGNSDASPVAKTLTPTSGVWDLEIGKIASRSNGYRFNGSIDEVRIYNRELSANEIKELYYQGVGR